MSILSEPFFRFSDFEFVVEMRYSYTTGLRRWLLDITPDRAQFVGDKPDDDYDPLDELTRCTLTLKTPALVS